MAVVAKATDGEAHQFEIAPSGMQPAVLSKIFDVGLQHTDYQGQPKDQHKVVFVWELAARISEGEYAGQRFVLSKVYTLSLHEKANLRKDIESWKGKAIPDEKAREGIDLEKFLKTQCTLNVVHYEKKTGYDGARIQNILPPGKDDPMLVPELADEWCPDWIRGMMAEGAGATGDMGQKETFEDDVPF